jgi:ribonucleoside-diphosphate reductase
MKDIVRTLTKVKEVGRNDPPPLMRSNKLQRSGAGVVYLNVFHPDIVSFLSTKKENADEKIRVKTLSLGVTVAR